MPPLPLTCWLPALSVFTRHDWLIPTWKNVICRLQGFFPPASGVAMPPPHPANQRKVCALRGWLIGGGGRMSKVSAARRPSQTAGVAHSVATVLQVLKASERFGFQIPCLVPLYWIGAILVRKKPQIWWRHALILTATGECFQAGAWPRHN